MTVPTVLATTARRNWVLCSVSERPPAAFSAVVIRFLRVRRALSALSQQSDASNYRMGGIPRWCQRSPVSNGWAARPQNVMVICRVEAAFARAFVGERRTDQDQCGSRDTGAFHLVANIGEGAANQLLVGPA